MFLFIQLRVAFGFIHLRMTFGFFVTARYCDSSDKPVVAEPRAVYKWIRCSFPVWGCVGHLAAVPVSRTRKMARTPEFVSSDWRVEYLFSVWVGSCGTPQVPAVLEGSEMDPASWTLPRKQPSYQGKIGQWFFWPPLLQGVKSSQTFFIYSTHI